MKQVAIGIDIGGTNSSIGVVDREGNVLYEKKPQLPTPQKQENPDARQDVSTRLRDNFIELITSEVRVAIETIGSSFTDLEVAGIGIGAPFANYYDGTMGVTANLPFTEVIKLTELIQAKLPEFSIVKVTNDANAAALGELIYGGGIGMRNFVMITLGTGLGTGLIVNGDLVYGEEGFAGELGHATAVPDGRDCGCGGKGHLETYCSATGIKRTVFELLAKHHHSESPLAKVSYNDMTAKMVYEAALLQDPVALEVFEFTGEILGRSLADAVHCLGPEAIFLFGGPTAAGELLFKPTRESLEHYLFPFYRNKIKILPSKLKAGSAAIVGASALVWKELDKLK